MSYNVVHTLHLWKSKPIDVSTEETNIMFTFIDPLLFDVLKITVCN